MGCAAGSPPITKQLKLNFDGSVRSRKAGAGFVATNDVGALVGVACIPVATVLCSKPSLGLMGGFCLDLGYDSGLGDFAGGIYAGNSYGFSEWWW